MRMTSKKISYFFLFSFLNKQFSDFRKALKTVIKTILDLIVQRIEEDEEEVH
jgi:hypothetical protein